MFGPFLRWKQGIGQVAAQAIAVSVVISKVDMHATRAAIRVRQDTADQSSLEEKTRKQEERKTVTNTPPLHGSSPKHGKQNAHRQADATGHAAMLLGREATR